MMIDEMPKLFVVTNIHRHSCYCLRMKQNGWWCQPMHVYLNNEVKII